MLTRVPPELTPMTRRRVLLGAAVSPLLVVATACTEDPPPTVAPDPDREALQAAYLTEDELRSALTGWASSRADAKAAAVGVVDQHLQVLSTSLGGAPSLESTASASNPAETTATVIRRLDAAADEHSKALRTSGAQVGPLLASIAASDAALAASLRGNDR